MDSQDSQPFKQMYGAANRGFYAPLREGPLPNWPDYMRNVILVDPTRGTSRLRELAFRHVIYLHGGTCSTDVGLTMTLAHELQHFVQHDKAPHLWAVNTLVTRLPRDIIDALALKWCDIPHEREARIVAKRTAEALHGAEAVGRYVEAMIEARVTDSDAEDWTCIRDLAIAIPYDLDGETRLFLPRLRKYRSELESELLLFQGNPDFAGVDLGSLFGGGTE